MTLWQQEETQSVLQLSLTHRPPRSGIAWGLLKTQNPGFPPRGQGCV